MGIQHQPKRHFEEFSVTETLGLLNRQHVLDGLQLHEQTNVNKYDA